MRTHFVLIDFENVQRTSLAGLDAEHFRVLVFVGANQNKLSFETAAALQKLGSRAEYIKISGNGSNALDFHIAYYIGHLAAPDPTACFHIISKDTGFDVLIQHLTERKVHVARWKDVSEIPLLKAANATSIPDKVSVVVRDLHQRGASKPRTVKTLTSTINALFKKQLKADELDAMLLSLQSEGFLSIDETKVTYTLTAAE